MSMHTIRTTQQPGVQITVDEAEYQQLFAWGLIYNGTAPLTPADFYDSEIADRVANGTATPAALRAAFVPFWAAAETVTAGTVRVDSTGHLITRNANGTTRATYDATEQAAWTVTSSGGGGGGAVTSVAGRTGVVVLSSSDLSDSTATGRSLVTTASAAAARTTLGLGTAATQPTSAFDAAGAATAAAALRAPLLAPTATKTAAYTVAVGELALMNVPAGATALTLPAAPADKSQVGYRAIGATATVPLTINRGGSDTIGTAGATSTSIPFADEVAVLQYDAANTRWLAVSNVKTQASLDTRYPLRNPVFPGSGGLIPVASSTMTASGTSSYGADALRSWPKKHVLLVDSPVIVLEYVNWYPSGGVDVDGPTAITLRVGIEKNNTLLGTNIVPVKFGGADTISVPPGATVRSDPVFIDGKAGDIFWERVTCTAASGTTYVYTGTSSGWAFSPVQDNSRSGTNYAGGNNQMVGAVRILGLPPTGSVPRIIALQGDSIMQGAQATLQYEGAFEVALNTQRIPYVKVPKGGEIASSYLAFVGGARRQALVAGCTHFIEEYGTNDAQAGATYATITANKAAIWARNLRTGMTAGWATTITPRSTSTDSFVTTANQTPVAGFEPGGVRSQVNAWIRAGAPLNAGTLAPVAVGTGGALIAGQAGHPLLGYIEVADAVESARDTGIYKANFTGDGVHPNQAGHDAILAAIPSLVG